MTIFKKATLLFLSLLFTSPAFAETQNHDLTQIKGVLTKCETSVNRYDVKVLLPISV